jgi:hydrogenase-4 component F
MAVAIALGTGSAFSQQALNHSAAKVALFLLAGNVLQATGTKRMSDLRGLLASRPALGMLIFLAMLAVAGTPPFGSFAAEWTLLRVAVSGGHAISAGVLLAALAVAFIALALQTGAVLFGQGAGPAESTAARSVAVPAVLVLAALLLGVMVVPACLQVGAAPLVGLAAGLR